MLFLSTLTKYEKDIHDIVEELFHCAFKNQSHPQDLLLVLENGFYINENREFYKNNNLSPYVIGPGNEGYSSQTQYRFYDSYRRNIIENKEEFIDNVKNKIDNLHITEENSIQLELMIYLKFWESEQIVKRLFQLSRLARGLEYDWHFNIEDFDKGRQQIIRKFIRDPLKEICPNFYELIKSIYNNQIRNAIAHSQFAISSRNININNKHLSKHYTLYNLTFEEWENIIHQVILLYNEIIRQTIKYGKIYADKSLPMHYGLPLRITYADKSTITRFYIYDKERDRWLWYESK